jgi:hypothetical protein
VAVERKSMGHTVCGRSWKNVFFVILAWRLRKSVLTLAVRENTISGRVVMRQRALVFQRRRLPSTGSRFDIRTESGCRESFFRVFSTAVVAKCFDACD